MTQEELTSIVLPHFGPLNLLKDCIQSIKENTAMKYEAIIIADECNDEALEYLLSLYKEGFRIVLNPQRLGGLVAYNLGSKMARGKYITLLSTDVRLAKRWLENMVEAIRLNPQFGWVALQCSSAFFPGVSLISKEALEKVGLYDEIFNDGEGFSDDDLLLRMWKAGYEPHLISKPTVEHLIRGTVRHIYGEKDLGESWHRNQGLFQARWGKASSGWGVPIYSVG